MPTRAHGGPGAGGPARFDFSTTGNACGPCPAVLAAVRNADYAHYPDPRYTALRAKLARLHGVAPWRVVFAASASEFIFRITAISGPGPVAVPRHSFGDYATAANGFGRTVFRLGADAGMGPDTGTPVPPASLVWTTDPHSPSGQSVAPPSTGWPPPDVWAVLDRACEPLRLHGQTAWSPQALDGVFQLYSPNKALGLTGVRGAYAIAPMSSTAAQDRVRRLDAACPSWPLGAAGVALLDAWATADVQAWLADSRDTLRAWQLRQTAGLTALGFDVLPTVTNFSLLTQGAARAQHQPQPQQSHQAQPQLTARLRAAGIAWRDTTSFGLPGAWRVSVQPPAAQDHLFAVLAGGGG